MPLTCPVTSRPQKKLWNQKRLLNQFIRYASRVTNIHSELPNWCQRSQSCHQHYRYRCCHQHDVATIIDTRAICLLIQANPLKLLISNWRLLTQGRCEFDFIHQRIQFCKNQGLIALGEIWQNRLHCLAGGFHTHQSRISCKICTDPQKHVLSPC